MLTSCWLQKQSISGEASNGHQIAEAFYTLWMRLLCSFLSVMTTKVLDAPEIVIDIFHYILDHL